jgi:hypothetical protein
VTKQNSSEQKSYTNFPINNSALAFDNGIASETRATFSTIQQKQQWLLQNKQ